MLAPLWPISRAVAVCGWRRAAPAMAANPLVTLVAGAALAGLVPLSVVGGERAGSLFGPAIAESAAVAESLAFSLGATAVLLGALAASVAPRRGALGPQLQAAPVGPLPLFVAVTAIPVFAVGALVGGLSLLFLLPAAAATPGGVGAGVVAVAAGAAGFGLGAAAVEALLALRAGVATALAPLGGVAVAWTLGALGAGAGAVVGPFGYLAAALRGQDDGVGRPASALAGLALGALLLWALAAAVRPDDAAGRGAVRAVVPIPARAAAAVFVTAAKRYARRPELRRQAAAVVVLAGGGGALLAVLVDGSGAAVALFAGTLAALGGAAVPLAGPGIDREAEWLWRTAPMRRWVLAAAAAAAALAGGLAVSAVGAAPALAVTRPPPGRLAELLAVAAFTLGAALLAGALVPWRSGRPAEELVSLAALALVAGGLWLLLSRLAETASTAGLRGRPVTAALLVLELGAAVAAASFAATRGERC